MDNGRIEGGNPIWVKTFDRVELQKNLGKTKAMLCTPRFIWGKQGVVAYNWRDAGGRGTFIERNKTRVSCE